VHTGCRVVGVERRDDHVVLRDDAGGSHVFDKAILTSTAAGIEHQTWLEREVLSKVRYPDAEDGSFLAGHVHGDVSVLPEPHRETILRDYCTFIDVVEDGRGGLRYENHFVLSSWVPAARGCSRAMMVYYNKPEGRTLEPFEKTIANRRAHPDLSAGNLARASLLRFFQGRGSLYYAGSYTTPGNGHDLSLLSGLVVANAVGAPYPFEHDPRARSDFERLRRFMLG
jgi:predicted NAD/FAD-binding protein